MKKFGSLYEFIDFLRCWITDVSFMERFRANPWDFTRVRKLPFSRLMFLCLNYITKPTFTEALHFFINVIGVDYFVSQQSVSEARQKIRYQAFQELFERMRDKMLKIEDLDLFHGYRLFAIDGTTVQLKNVPEVKEHFGAKTPCEGEVFARMSMIFDVLNEFIVDAELVPFQKGERQMAVEGVKRTSGQTGICLYLMDRGYWSPELYAEIIESGNAFLARVPNGVTTEIRSGAERVSIEYQGKTYRLRCKRFVLISGETETLVTNLTEDELSAAEMEELYHLRWGIETKYNELKNDLAISTLPGKTYNSVMQDFYATLVVSNLATLASYDAQVEIDCKQQGKNNKYNYKPNKSVILSTLKDHLIASVSLDNPLKKAYHMAIIQRTLSARPNPGRPGRSAPRQGKTSLRKKHGKRPPL